MSNLNKKVRAHYCGTLDDGTKFDSSYDRDEPIEFVCGAGQMIKGFDKAVEDMQVGEKKTVHLAPEDAYGVSNPDLIITFPIEEVPNADEMSKGDKVGLMSAAGYPIPATIISIDENAVTIDANHELAGKALNFDIELVEVFD